MRRNIYAKKIGMGIMVSAILLSTIGLSAGAVGVSGDLTKSTVSGSIIEPRASGSFHADIPANSAIKVDQSFQLQAKEVVTINASYSPSSAKLDFGLIAPDGSFHYVSVTGGSASKKIQVDEKGAYTLAVRNNSSFTVDVSCYVNY